MTDTKTQLPAAQQNGTQNKTLSPSDRFTNAILREFSNNGAEVSLTPFQKKLCQNFFIKLDSILKEQEIKRMRKSEKYREQLPYTWENLNLQRLAQDVIIYSSVGLDPTQPNHINTIPFKNTATNKYDIAFIMGYKGVELKAKKYGLDIPDDVIVELIYSTDKFKQFKKDINNKIEGYTFEVTDDLNRGEIVGGFYYHRYFDNPEKNKLRVFSKKDIDKRKPDHASVEFWGGEKDVWDTVDGKNKKVGTETVEGWYDEMAFKTIYKAAYNSITIDSEKIDSNYLAVLQREQETRDLKLTAEIAENANKDEIGFKDEENNSSPAEENNVDKTTGEVKENVQQPEGQLTEKAEEKVKEKVKEKIPAGTQTKAPF